jgi:hypothetical protein
MMHRPRTIARVNRVAGTTRPEGSGGDRLHLGKVPGFVRRPHLELHPSNVTGELGDSRQFPPTPRPRPRRRARTCNNPSCL